jgi:hypothetical protein
VIALLLSPIGRWVGAFLLTLVTAYGLIALGHYRGSAASEAKWQARMATEQARQAAVHAKALDESVARELARAAENEQLEQKVLDYEAYLAKRPAAAGCVLDSGDVDRLRKLQGPGSP